jgi:uncharacterized ferritin-like protein (DUF455 family)
MDLKQIGFQFMEDWTNLAQESVQQWAFLNMVINL